MRSKTLLFVVFSFFLLASSCSATRFLGAYARGGEKKPGKMENWVYTSKLNSYRVGPLSGSWKKAAVKGGDIAFHNAESGSVMTASSVCPKRKYGLETLSDSLAAGLAKKRMKLRKEIAVGAGKGLYSEYEFVLDGEKFALATAVHKSGGCDYDFSYSAYPAGFADGLGEFMDFLSGFEELRAK